MVEVIDNFLDEHDFQVLASHLVNDQPKWGLIQGINQIGDGTVQFVNPLYAGGAPRSPDYDLIQPILDKLNVGVVIRCKVNCNLPTEEIKEYGMHRDIEELNVDGLKIAVLYINGNDGYTHIKDYGKVESVPNRLVKFDNDMLHSGSSCTNAIFRMVLNLVYIEVKE